ncbi:MAG: DNA/RNA nuclease SfsA [Nitrososphaerota archaeon]
MILKIKVDIAVVRRRLNRFVVKADYFGKSLRLYLRNTGRLSDLLQPGSAALFIRDKGPRTDGLLVGIAIDDKRAAILDTGLQTVIFEESWRRGLIPWLEGWRIAKREYRYYDSRIDYLIVKGEAKGLLEVKSAVYHLGDYYCMYPDTISIRGRRHIERLIQARRRNYHAFLVFIAAHPSCRYFRPCREADPVIGEILRKARDSGVNIYSVKMYLTIDGEAILDSSSIPVLI